jgi:putative spermidine/putrescine transport system ATP-binding protein/spermidine/putrescine transport system ATP-binding protein
LDSAGGFVSESSARHDAALSLRSIAKSFGPIKAVDGVDLDIGQDEFVAFLGPSGSGKTTLLRIIAGLEQPDRGKVIVRGQDVTTLPPYRRQIGMVFQSFLLFPHKTVAENIVFPLRMKRVPKPEQRERLGWALRLLHLEGLGDRYPNELSGGQQQRVALARGLIARPAFLLLDEPLANLDRELRAEMEVEIRRYQKELTIPFLYVTHNQEEALTMSDRIAVMRNGSFEQVAPRTEVYSNPATAFVAAFVGHSNRIEGVVSGVAGAQAKLTWNGTEVIVPLPKQSTVGDRAVFFVKYEDIGISRERTASANPENRLEGKLRDIIFKGQVANYFITLPNGAEIVASGAPRAMSIRPGEPVYASWEAGRGSSFRIGAP